MPSETDRQRLAEYRQWLVAAEQKSQDDFDKTVLSLSGGALGISFVFLKDVIGTNPVLGPKFLLVAWMSWGFSTLAVLASFYLSHLALRKAISQVDSGTIRTLRPGGALSTATASFNAIGAILFLVGVCSITAFAHANLSTKRVTHVESQAITADPQAPLPTTPPVASATSTAPDQKGDTGEVRPRP